MNKILSHALLPAILGLGLGTARADQFSTAQTYMEQGRPRDAQLVLRNVVRDHPDNGQANFMLAQLDLELDQPVSAEREARAARAAGYQPGKSLTLLLNSYIAQRRYVDLLHDFPVGGVAGETGARIAVARARANLALDRSAHVKADLDQAAQLDPKLPAVWLAKQDVALAGNDRTAADAALVKAKTLAPDDSHVIVAESQAAFTAGNAEGAVALLKPLVAREPANIEIRIRFANALIAAHQINAAEAQIHQVLTWEPGSVGAIYLQASIDLDHQQWKAAQADLQKLSTVMSNLPGAYMLQAQALAHLGEIAAAQSAAEHYVAKVPDDLHGRALLAALALQNGDARLALKTVDDAGAAGQNDFGLVMVRGAAEQHLGNTAAARDAFTRAAALQPQNLAPTMNLGLLDMQAGNTDAAVRRFRAAAATQPDNPAVENALARAAIAAHDLPTARAAVARLTKLRPTADSALLAAQLDLAAYDLSAATVDYQRALAADPKNAAARLGLAHVALMRGDRGTAGSEIKAAVKVQPTNPAAVSALAALQAQDGALTQAHATLATAQQLAPNSPVFAADLVSLDIRMKDLDGAAKLLQGLPPGLQNNPTILRSKAQLAVAKHDPGAAKAALAALLDHNPADSGARLGLAQIDAASGDAAGGMKVLDAGLAASPHDLTLMEAELGLTFHTGGSRPALALAVRLADDPAHQPESAVLPGSVQLAAHQPAAAVTAFTTAMKTTPSALLALNLARAQAATGDRAGARATLQQAITRFGSNPALDDAAGQLALASNDLDGAATAFRAALARAPDDAVALNNLAWIDGKQQQPDAVELATRAYALHPDPQVADTLGWILLQRNRAEDAVSLLRQAHAGMPQNANVSYHYAAALAQTGDKVQAKAILATALQGGGAFTDRPAAEKLNATLGRS